MPTFQPMTDEEILRLIEAQTQVFSLRDEDTRGLLHHVILNLIRQVRESDAGRLPNPFTKEGKAEIKRRVEELDELLRSRYGAPPIKVP